MESKNQIKKALIFDPYLDTLGGGERYVLAFGLELQKLGFEVEIAWKDPKTLKAAEDRFGQDYSQFIVSPNSYRVCTNNVSIWKKFLYTKDYELIFWVSDGSLPALFSPKNFVHFQVPFKKLGGSILGNFLKSILISKFIYNSEFTRSFYNNSLNNNKALVLYPPIDIASLAPKEKKKIILSVARFSSTLTSKRHDILIETFKILSQKAKDYKLVLAGGLVGDNTIISKLKSQSKNFNIEIIPNPSFAQLKELYSHATFFWHAAGYGIDEKMEPEKVEHFGMTTVEAMASGCIPIVINKGGQREVVTNTKDGYLVENSQEMIEKTLEIINSKNISSSLSDQALVKSKRFGLENFSSKVKSLISES